MRQLADHNAVAARLHHRRNFLDLSNAANSMAGYWTALLFGNPAVFPLRGDPWLCDPASQRVCRFGRRCRLFGNNPNIASPLSDNRGHNNSGQQDRGPKTFQQFGGFSRA
jgi:hypothetical protein